MLYGVPASPFPMSHSLPRLRPSSLFLLSNGHCWPKQNWPQGDPPHPPQGQTQGPPGSSGFPAGKEEGKSHKGHLPRRQRKVRRGGGFILRTGELSGGAGAGLQEKGESRGTSDLRAPPRFVKYRARSTPHH